MRIAITGTPGTGKSTIAPLVGEELDMPVIDLNDEIADHDIAEGFDEDREASMVDPEQLNAAIDLPEDCIVDGHLAHFLNDIDLVVVLRTDPSELEDRLQEKDWEEEKIEENVMAERIDVILQEAADRYPDSTVESDTTARSPEKVVEEIVYMVQNPDVQEMYAPGGTDWMMEDDLDGMPPA